MNNAIATINISSKIDLLTVFINQLPCVEQLFQKIIRGCLLTILQYCLAGLRINVFVLVKIVVCQILIQLDLVT